MNDHQRAQADLLDQFHAALGRDPGAAPPDGLEPDLAGAAARVSSALRPPEPTPDFAERLRLRLEEVAAGRVSDPSEPASVLQSPGAHHNGVATAPSLAATRDIRRRSFRRPLLSAGRLAGAAALVVAIVALYGWSIRPASVSAREIVQRVQAVDRSPAAANITSFEMTTRISARPGAGSFRIAGDWDDLVVFTGLPGEGDEPVQAELRQWYQGPDRLRAEIRILGSQGTGGAVLVSDGRDLWRYDTTETVAHRARLDGVVLSTASAVGVVSFVASGPGTASPAELPRWKAAWLAPKLQERDGVVAGRAAYVIAFDPAAAQPAKAVAPSEIGRTEIWVDKETFFILKSVDYSAVDGRPVISSEVTSVGFNTPIDPERFRFTPPPDVPVIEESGPTAPRRTIPVAPPAKPSRSDE